jgi:hypothetical protein
MHKRLSVNTIANSPNNANHGSKRPRRGRTLVGPKAAVAFRPRRGRTLVGHHRQKTFEEEFIKTLSIFKVEIGQKKMFNFFLPDLPTCDLSEVFFNSLFA